MRTRLSLGGLILGLLLGCGSNNTSALPSIPMSTNEDSGFFEDVTATSGLIHTYRNGEEAGHFAILESLGGGVGLLDYDGDGLVDILLTGGGSFEGPEKKEIRGYPCKLYRNLGDFRFEDVTSRVGLDRLANGEPWFYTHGVAVADYDNDGWSDLLITGWGRLALFHNEPDGQGGRRFQEVAHKAGLTSRSWSTSAGWGDVDGDGFPDLYICHYVDWSFANHPPCKDYRTQKDPDVCAPKVFQALPHALYHNNRDGTFTEISDSAGLHRPRREADYAQLSHLSPEERAALKKADSAQDYGKGLGVILFDADGDGQLDIYVANDTTANFLYLNRGMGRFVEVGLERGVAFDDNAAPNGSMGVDVADYTASGALSLFVANYQNEAHALYRNRGKGQFVYASRAAGINAVGLIYVGFGAGFVDYDNDGREDLVLSNGHVVRTPPLPGEVKQKPLLLRNLRRPGEPAHAVRFENISAQGGPYFRSAHLGRGLALGDLDNDGRVDMVLNPMNEPATILRNRIETGHHWLGITLVGTPNRDAVGARLELEGGEQRGIRVVKGGGSYLSARDRRTVFGLGTQDRVERLKVRWPSGKTQTWEGLALDRYHTLVEGEAKPR